ncbi:MAG TPA: hypothetical protein PK078_13525 [Anaerolineales bacterium]|nr:hypothetical protein [Anaerolineales bacterium]HNA90318.1 hypothetical protein [Anaerolineales bacterium]HNB37430.1 hypothetical protein [Anaerolineales bacterium]
MKTILPILVILLITAVVSGGIYALVENTSLLSSSEAEHGVPPQMTSADGTSFQPMERPDGGDDHDAASLSRGLGEVGVLLAKITGITLIILTIQKALGAFQKHKPAAAQLQ